MEKYGLEIGNKVRKINRLILIFSIIIFLPATIFAAAPVILYTDITSGPNTGAENNNGAYLSIFGENFGADINSIKVYVGTGEVVRYIYLGSSHGRSDIQQLSVQLGSETTTGSIRVEVDGVQSNADHTFTVRSGDIYFVSLTGSDSTGERNDIDQPYRTPNFVKGLSGFGPGDFIIVRGGIYDLNDGTNNIKSGAWWRQLGSGTDGYPLTFMGYPGEDVIARMDTPLAIVSTASSSIVSYFVIANIIADVNHCQNGVTVSIGGAASSQRCTHGNVGEANYVRVVNIEIDGDGVGGMCSGGSGNNMLVVGYSTNVKLLGNSIHDTGIPSNGEHHSHPIYLATTQHDTEVGWNSLYNIPYSRAVIQVHQDGFDGCWSVKTLTDIAIHDNLIHDVEGQAILLGGGTGDIILYNNIIYNTPLNGSGYSDIIALRGNGGTLNAKLYNNTIYANPAYTDVGEILRFGQSSYDPEHVTLYNNIFYIVESNDSYSGKVHGSWSDSNITSDNNIWYGSSNGLPSFAGSNDKTLDPKFINFSTGNFRLQSDSLAKDAGTSSVSTVLTRDFSGGLRSNPFDIGAYEYSYSESDSISSLPPFLQPPQQ